MLADLGPVDNVDTGPVRKGRIDDRAAVRDRPFYPFGNLDHELVQFARYFELNDGFEALEHLVLNEDRPYTIT